MAEWWDTTGERAAGGLAPSLAHELVSVGGDRMTFARLSRELAARKMQENRLSTALASTEQTTALLLEFLPELILLVCDCQLRYRWVGGSGWSADPHDLIGKTPVEALGPELGAAVEARYREALLGDVQFQISARGRRWLCHGRPLSLDGNCVGMVLVGRPLGDDADAGVA